MGKMTIYNTSQEEEKQTSAPSSGFFQSDILNEVVHVMLV